MHPGAVDHDPWCSWVGAVDIAAVSSAIGAIEVNSSTSSNLAAVKGHRFVSPAKYESVLERPHDSVCATHINQE